MRNALWRAASTLVRQPRWFQHISRSPTSFAPLVRRRQAVAAPIPLSLPAPAACSRQGRSSVQEDRVVVTTIGKADAEQEESRPIFAAVFDGHSGEDAADYAAGRIAALLDGHVAALCDSETMSDALERSLQDLHTELRSHLASKPRCGTTVACCVVEQDKCTYAHIGDSTCVLCATKEGAVRLTEPHRPDRDDEMDRIVKAGGRISFVGAPRVAGILAMTRALGAFHLEDQGVVGVPEMGCFDVDTNACFLLLTTDGVSDYLTDMEAASLVANTSSPDEAVRAICDRAISYGSKDNVTACVVPLPGWGSDNPCQVMPLDRNLVKRCS